MSDHLDPYTNFDAVAVMHSFRFRAVANAYPRTVALAYDRDIARAAADSDDEVAAKVAEWERQQGLPVRDWQAIGRLERDE
jgi:hypothetical protein